MHSLYRKCDDNTAGTVREEQCNCAKSTNVMDIPLSRRLFMSVEHILLSQVTPEDRPGALQDVLQRLKLLYICHYPSCPLVARKHCVPTIQRRSEPSTTQFVRPAFARKLLFLRTIAEKRCLKDSVFVKRRVSLVHNMYAYMSHVP